MTISTDDAGVLYDAQLGGELVRALSTWSRVLGQVDPWLGVVVTGVEGGRLTFLACFNSSCGSSFAAHDTGTGSPAIACKTRFACGSVVIAAGDKELAKHSEDNIRVEEDVEQDENGSSGYNHIKAGKRIPGRISDTNSVTGILRTSVGSQLVTRGVAGNGEDNSTVYRDMCV